MNIKLLDLSNIPPNKTGMTNEEIWEKYHKLIYKICHKAVAKYPHLKFDAVLSSVANRVYMSLKQYDPTKSALSTFIYQRGCYSAIDEGIARKKRKEIPYSPIGTETDLSIFEKEEDTHFTNTLKRGLSPEALELIELLINPPKCLSECIDPIRKIATIKIVREYAIDVLDWTSTMWDTYFAEIKENMHYVGN